MADKIGTDEYGEILIYQTDDGQTNIEVKIEDDTVWLTQQQLTELYQCSKSNISEIIISKLNKQHYIFFHHLQLFGISEQLNPYPIPLLRIYALYVHLYLIYDR